MNKKFLAIIPARGGSKRLPKKNVLPLIGKPLIAWTIDAAKNSELITSVYVSSDSEEILTIAKDYGVFSVRRPNTLASDTATSFDAVKHAIEEIHGDFDYVVLLQPTSPLRTAQHIDDAIKLLQEKSADAVISVCEMEHSPLWCNTLPEDQNMVNFLPKESLVRSQDLPTYYRLNGAIYICQTDKLLTEETFFLSDNIFSYVMPRKSSVDIDSEIDFYTVESILRNNQ